MRTTPRISTLFGTLAGAIALSVGLGLTAPAHAVDDPTAAVRQLPDSDLKVFYLRCARAAGKQALSSGEIALCSVGYQTLLDRTFGGDFLALLAWSSTATDEADFVASSGTVKP